MSWGERQPESRGESDLRAVRLLTQRANSCLFPEVPGELGEGVQLLKAAPEPGSRAPGSGGCPVP